MPADGNIYGIKLTTTLKVSNFELRNEIHLPTTDYIETYTYIYIVHTSIYVIYNKYNFLYNQDIKYK